MRLHAVDAEFLEAVQEAFDCAVSAFQGLALWRLFGASERTIDDGHEFSTNHKVTRFLYRCVLGSARLRRNGNGELIICGNQMNFGGPFGRDLPMSN